MATPTVVERSATRAVSQSLEWAQLGAISLLMGRPSFPPAVTLHAVIDRQKGVRHLSILTHHWIVVSAGRGPRRVGYSAEY